MKMNPEDPKSDKKGGNKFFRLVQGIVGADSKQRQVEAR